MKHLIYLLVILSFTGCRKDTLPEVGAAERMMMRDPEVALTLLQMIENPEKLQGEKAARYALRMTQALDKTYYHFTSDSLIRIALDYYIQHPDSLLLAESYRYTGRVNYELGNRAGAYEYYQKAIDVSPHKGYEQQLSVLHNYVGWSWFQRYEYDKALPHFQKCIEIATVMNDTNYLPAYLNSLAFIYIKKSDAEGADSLLFRARNITFSNPDYTNQCEIYSNMSEVQTLKGNHKKALFFWNKEKECKHWNFDSVTIYSQGARICLRQNNSSRASALLDSVAHLSAADSSEIYNVARYELYQQTGDYKKALEYCLKYTDIHTYAQNNKDKILYAEIESRYDNERRVRQSFEIASARRETILWVGIAFLGVLVSILVAVAIYFFFKKRSLELADRYVKLDERNSQLSDSLKTMEVKSDLFRQYLYSFDEFKNICNRLSGDSDETRMRTLHKLMRNDDDMLMRYITIEYSDLVVGLRTLMPDLNDSDLIISFFYYIGLDDTQIITLLDTTKETYRKRKFRLWKKLSVSEQAAAFKSLEELVKSF